MLFAVLDMSFVLLCPCRALGGLLDFCGLSLDEQLLERTRAQVPNTAADHGLGSIVLGNRRELERLAGSVSPCDSFHRRLLVDEHPTELGQPISDLVVRHCFLLLLFEVELPRDSEPPEDLSSVIDRRRRHRASSSRSTAVVS